LQSVNRRQSDVLKFIGVGAGTGVFEPETGADLESEKCDSTHPCGKQAYRQTRRNEGLHVIYLTKRVQ